MSQESSLLQPEPPVPIPTNRLQLDALVMKRSELTNQLKIVGDRRNELWTMAKMSDPASRDALSGRVRALEERGARLEQQILQADDAIAAAIARGIPLGQSTSLPGADVRTHVVRAMILEGVTFVLLGVVLFTWMSRRAKARLSRAIPDSTQRLDQLQQSIDVIALEVERIAEGQRFVTKVLNEKLPSLGVGERV